MARAPRVPAEKSWGAVGVVCRRGFQLCTAAGMEGSASAPLAFAPVRELVIAVCPTAVVWYIHKRCCIIWYSL